MTLILLSDSLNWYPEQPRALITGCVMFHLSSPVVYSKDCLTNLFLWPRRTRCDPMIKACQPLFLLKSVLFMQDAFMSAGAAWTNKFQVGRLEVMLTRNTEGDTNNAHVHLSGCHKIDFNGYTLTVDGHMCHFWKRWNKKTASDEQRFLIFNTYFPFACSNSRSLIYVSVRYWDSRNRASRGACDTWGRCLNQPIRNGLFRDFFFLFVPPRNYQQCAQHLKPKDKVMGLYRSRLWVCVH